MKSLILALILVHSWYPEACCGEYDCRPVDCSTIVEHPDGSVNWLMYHFEAWKVKVSKDTHCHVCINYNAGRAPLCAFLSPST